MSNVMTWPQFPFVFFVPFCEVLPGAAAGPQFDLWPVGLRTVHELVSVKIGPGAFELSEVQAFRDLLGPA